MARVARAAAESNTFQDEDRIAGTFFSGTTSPLVKKPKNTPTTTSSPNLVSETVSIRCVSMSSSTHVLVEIVGVFFVHHFLVVFSMFSSLSLTPTDTLPPTPAADPGHDHQAMSSSAIPPPSSDVVRSSCHACFFVPATTSLRREAWCEMLEIIAGHTARGLLGVSSWLQRVPLLSPCPRSSRSKGFYLPSSLIDSASSCLLVCGVQSPPRCLLLLLSASSYRCSPRSCYCRLLWSPTRHYLSTGNYYLMPSPSISTSSTLPRHPHTPKK